MGEMVTFRGLQSSTFSIFKNFSNLNFPDIHKQILQLMLDTFFSAWGLITQSTAKSEEKLRRVQNVAARLVIKSKKTNSNLSSYKKTLLAIR